MTDATAPHVADDGRATICDCEDPCGDHAGACSELCECECAA